MTCSADLEITVKFGEMIMARPLSGKKSQQDENALRQLKNANKYQFWSKQFLVRRFYIDNKDNFEKFYIAQEALYFAIYYKKFYEGTESFDLFLKSALNRYSDKESIEKYDNILNDMIHKIYNEEPIDNKICSIMDSFLNLTETNPANKLSLYTKCDDFYLEKIEKHLLILKEFCLKYGLYPHRFEKINAEDVILNLRKTTIYKHENCFFLHIPEINPPVIFNYCTQKECFFEKELPNKFYYYHEIDIDKDVDKIVKNIKQTLHLFSKKDEEYIPFRPQKYTDKSVQICIDIEDKHYSEKTAITHVKFELVSAMLYLKKSLSLQHLASVNKKEPSKERNALNAKLERLVAQKNNIMLGGYMSRFNDAVLACGMYIWDLEHIHGVPHTIIEALLANDTRQQDKVINKLSTFNLENLHHPFYSIKKELALLNCDMNRTALHRNYASFNEKINNCLKHALWRE